MYNYITMDPLMEIAILNIQIKEIDDMIESLSNFDSALAVPQIQIAKDMQIDLRKKLLKLLD